MERQISWDTLEKVIATADNWLVSFLTLYTDETCDLSETDCHSVTLSYRKDKHILYYGPSTWSDDFDDFAFDIHELRCDNRMNSEKILENVKQMCLRLACHKEEQEFKDLRQNGPFISEYRGWEKILDNL
jgi:hypothetical protein